MQLATWEKLLHRVKSSASQKDKKKLIRFLGPDTADVESLKVEIEKLKEQLADMTSRAETAEASVAELQGKLDASEADQSEPKEEPKPE